jgi:hypothetical protein
MVERLRITPYKFLTRDQYGNTTFDSDKQYIKTDAASAYRLELNKGTFSTTNPHSLSYDWTSWNSGNEAGMTVQFIKPDRPDTWNGGSMETVSFPVGGYGIVHWMRGTAPDNDTIELSADDEYFSPQVNFISYLIYVRYESGYEQYVGNVYSTYGLVQVGDGKGASNVTAIFSGGNNIGAGLLSTSRPGSIYINLPARSKMVFRSYQNLSQYPVTGYDKYGYYSVQRPALPNVLQMISWVSYDKDYPLGLTL